MGNQEQEKKLGLKLKLDGGLLSVSDDKDQQLFSLNIVQLVNYAVAKSPNKVDDAVVGAVSPALSAFSYERSL